MKKIVILSAFAVFALGAVVGRASVLCAGRAAYRAEVVLAGIDHAGEPEPADRELHRDLTKSCDEGPRAA